MKELKYIFLIVLFFSITFILCGFIRMRVYNEKEYNVYFMDKGLILFHLKIEKKKAYVDEVEYLDDIARKLYENESFEGQELISVIDSCAKKASNNTMIKLYLWTNWQNEKYFETSDFNLEVRVLETEALKDLPSKVIPVFWVNEPYYKVGSPYHFSITFLSDGKMGYYADTHEDLVCKKYIDNECETIILDEEYYANTDSHHYSVDGNKLIMESTEKNYFGYVAAYHECEIEYNRLRCDFYNKYKNEELILVSTEYYEIKEK